MTGLILLGPPGVGKGTQAKLIAERLSIPTISTGHIFRTNIKAGTEMGKVAAEYMNQGAFVPDSVTNPMIEARLSAPDVLNGFLLDGYPRTLDQAHVLRDILAATGLKLDAVIAIEAPREVLVERMTRRAVIESRSDDNPEVFAHRLEEYEDRTEPIATYYADQDLLESVDGSGSVEDVEAGLIRALTSRGLC